MNMQQSYQKIMVFLTIFWWNKQTQAIPMGKLLEILEFAILVSWQHQVSQKKFDIN